MFLNISRIAASNFLKCQPWLDTVHVPSMSTYREVGFKITFSKLAQIYSLFSKTKISTGYFVENLLKSLNKNSLQWSGYCRL